MSDPRFDSDTLEDFTSPVQPVVILNVKFFYAMHDPGVKANVFQDFPKILVSQAREGSFDIKKDRGSRKVEGMVVLLVEVHIHDRVHDVSAIYEAMLGGLAEGLGNIGTGYSQCICQNAAISVYNGERSGISRTELHFAIM